MNNKKRLNITIDVPSFVNEKEILVLITIINNTIYKYFKKIKNKNNIDNIKNVIIDYKKKRFFDMEDYTDLMSFNKNDNNVELPVSEIQIYNIDKNIENGLTIFHCLN